MSKSSSLPFNRFHFVYLFDCLNGNPNGDPDRGNRPRQDPITNKGLASGGSTKRKIRNYVTLTRSEQDGLDIFVKERAILTNAQKEAYKIVGASPGLGENLDAQAEMIRRYWDVRLFGGIMSTGKENGDGKEEGDDEGDSEEGSPKAKGKAKKKGKVGGYSCGTLRQCVNIPYANSIDPIAPWNDSITVSALRNFTDTKQGKDLLIAFEDGDKSIDINKAASGNMGKFWRITYGLYRIEGSVCPHMGKRNGATADDLELLWEALQNMWELNQSVSRGNMNARRLIVFEHPGPYNAEPSSLLYDRVQVDKSCEGHPSSYKDYKVSVDLVGLESKGIKVREFI